jgi:hypothetical protein
MATMGLFWAIAGLVALVDQEYFTVRENTLLVASSYTTWGWVHLIGGLVSVAAGAGILWGGPRDLRADGARRGARRELIPSFVDGVHERRIPGWGVRRFCTSPAFPHLARGGR